MDKFGFPPKFKQIDFVDELDNSLKFNTVVIDIFGDGEFLYRG